MAVKQWAPGGGLPPAINSKRGLPGDLEIRPVWEPEADPELQPYVTEARQGIQRLTGEPTP